MTLLRNIPYAAWVILTGGAVTLYVVYSGITREWGFSFTLAMLWGALIFAAVIMYFHAFVFLVLLAAGLAMIFPHPRKRRLEEAQRKEMMNDDEHAE